MTNTTNHYDLIVVGSDVAGLVAAALVARRGKRVLVIPHGPVEGSYKLEGETLPLDVAPLVHLGCPAVRRVFEELGLWTQLRREHKPVREMCHFVLDDHRLDLEVGMGGFADEVAREWPGDPIGEAFVLRKRWSDATDALLDEVLGSEGALSAEGFWARRFLTKVSEQLPDERLDDLAPLPGDHPMRVVARAFEPWLQHLSPSQLGKAASLRLFGHVMRGPFDRVHGAMGLRKTLLQRIEMQSSEIKPSLRVGELMVKRGRVVGLSLLGKRDRYGCEAMIMATDPRTAGDGSLGEEQVPRAIAQNLESVAIVARRFVMHMDIDERGVSPAIGGTVVCLPRPAPDPSGVIVGAGARDGAGLVYLRPVEGGPEGRVRLAATRIVAAEEPLEDMRERIIDELDQRGVLPFVRDHVHSLHSPHDGREASDGHGRPRDDGSGAPSSMRIAMEPIYASASSPPSLGVGLLPHGTHLRNLVYVSRMTFPGLGLEGEFAAGWAAAGLVAPPGRSGLSRNLFLGRG